LVDTFGDVHRRIPDHGLRAEGIGTGSQEMSPRLSALSASAEHRGAAAALRWSEVDWDACQIRKLGKGRRLVVTPITATVRAILWPLRGHHPEFVFTHIAQRARGKRCKGERYPLNASTAVKAWFKLRAAAKVTGFRFHDFRHDVGTKVLRETGNLKITQKVLNHRNIRTTLRYAHVLDDEVSDALERVAEGRKKSRKKSRTILREAS
jgi:integrase